MKKKFNLKKSIVGFTLAGALFSLGIQPAFAETPTIHNNVDQIVSQARAIQSFISESEFRNSGSTHGATVAETTLSPTGNTFSLKNTYVEPDGSPSITYDEAVYIGHSILHNTTNVDQTLTTQSFSETITETVSTTTTHTVGTSVSASSKFQIPFVGETGASFTASYNFSQNKTNTNSKAVTITVQPQRILVPANSSVEVNVYLNKAKIKGDVKLKGELVGSESGKATVKGYNYYPNGWITLGTIGYTFDLTEFAKKYGGNKGSMQNGTYFLGIVPNADGRINIAGKGTYEASIGSELVVETKNLSTQETLQTPLEGISINDKSNPNAYPTEVEYPSTKTIEMGSDASSNQKMVTLFKDDNYHGSSQKLGVGKYAYTSFPMIGDNALSSLYIPEGLKVILYENADFTGNQMELTSNTDLYRKGFNDKTSAIEIIDLSSASNSSEEERMVTLFKDDNYHGSSQKLGVGKYAYTSFPMIGDNALSSLYIPEGLKVILYENADFTGKQMILMHNTDLYSSTDFNDKTSAIEIIDLYAR